MADIESTFLEKGVIGAIALAEAGVIVFLFKYIQSLWEKMTTLSKEHLQDVKDLQSEFSKQMTAYKDSSNLILEGLKQNTQSIYNMVQSILNGRRK